MLSRCLSYRQSLLLVGDETRAGAREHSACCAGSPTGSGAGAGGVAGRAQAVTCARWGELGASTPQSPVAVGGAGAGSARPTGRSVPGGSGVARCVHRAAASGSDRRAGRGRAARGAPAQRAGARNCPHPPVSGGACLRGGRAHRCHRLGGCLPEDAHPLSRNRYPLARRGDRVHRPVASKRHKRRRLFKA